MRQPAERRLHPVELVAGLDQRDVEGPAIVGDEHERPADPARRDLVSDRVEQRALLAVAAQEVLTGSEAVLVEDAEADQERVGPGAAAEAGRLEVEEQEPRAGLRFARRQEAAGAAEEPRQRHARRTRRLRVALDRMPAVAMREGIPTFDDHRWPARAVGQRPPEHIQHPRRRLGRGASRGERGALVSRRRLRTGRRSPVAGRPRPVLQDVLDACGENGAVHLGSGAIS